jgi:hypothetical protein
MNPLIFIPSPRDLPEFNEATAKLPYDKLWSKYYNEDDAYRNGRAWFLEHQEYTHFLILPDDLIVRDDDIRMLSRISESFVMSGWCRNTIRKNLYWKGAPETEAMADSCISIECLPPDPPYQGTYDKFQFMSVKSIRAAVEHGFTAIEVKYAGFPPTVIPRRVVEKIPFRTSYGCCTDSCFALDLAANNIKQYCDLRIRTFHFDDTYDKVQVGKKEPKMYLEKRK